MQKERLYEESAISNRSRTEEKFSLFYKILAIACFAVALFIASFAFGYVPEVLHTTVADDGTVNVTARVFYLLTYFAVIVLVFGMGWIFWVIKNRFNVSYDYTFVEDELRINKVYNGKKRKYITTVKADRILQLGWVDSDAYRRAVQGLGGHKPKRFTPNKTPAEDKEFYYILVSSSIEKSIYIVEARQMLLEYLVLAAGKTKLERK